jgi:hypothetical protein
MSTSENNKKLLDPNDDGRLTHSDMEDSKVAEMINDAIELMPNGQNIKNMLTGLEAKAIINSGENYPDYTEYNEFLQAIVNDINSTTQILLKEDGINDPREIDTSVLDKQDKTLVDLLQASQIAYPEGVIGGADTATRDLPSPPGEKPYRSPLEI